LSRPPGGPAGGWSTAAIDSPLTREKPRFAGAFCCERGKRPFFMQKHAEIGGNNYRAAALEVGLLSEMRDLSKRT
jgi:hypothetical protein